MLLSEDSTTKVNTYIANHREEYKKSLDAYYLNVQGESLTNMAIENNCGRTRLLPNSMRRLSALFNNSTNIFF